VSAEPGSEAAVEALMSVVACFQLTWPRAKEILREAGRALGMSDRYLKNYADAFEHRERRAAQR
jgi:serine/threonine-protein kinase HipA